MAIRLKASQVFLAFLSLFFVCFALSFLLSFFVSFFLTLSFVYSIYVYCAGMEKMYHLMQPRSARRLKASGSAGKQSIITLMASTISAKCISWWSAAVVYRRSFLERKPAIVLKLSWSGIQMQSCVQSMSWGFRNVDVVLGVLTSIERSADQWHSKTIYYHEATSPLVLIRQGSFCLQQLLNDRNQIFAVPRRRACIPYGIHNTQVFMATIHFTLAKGSKSICAI